MLIGWMKMLCKFNEIFLWFVKGEILTVFVVAFLKFINSSIIVSFLKFHQKNKTHQKKLELWHPTTLQLLRNTMQFFDSVVKTLQNHCCTNTAIV